MHAISSYHGNKSTNKQTYKQTGPITIHCAAKLSAQCKNITKSSAVDDKPRDLFRGQSRLPNGVKKTRIVGLPGLEKSLTISSAVWIQYANVTERQTDRHRAAATHSVRGINQLIFHGVIQTY